MKHNIPFRFSLLCAFVFFLGQSDLFAGRLNITRAKQEMSNWCWAASTQMVLSYYTINKTQTEIVTYIKGSAVNQTGTTAEMVKALKNYGVPASSKGVLTEAQLTDAANKGSPFIFGWMWTSGGGHALVFDGYEGTQYYVIDPWQSNPTTAFSYNSLKTAGGKGTWSMSVCSDKVTAIQNGLSDNHPDGNCFFTASAGSRVIVFQINHVSQNGTITLYDMRGKQIHTIPVTQNHTVYIWNQHDRTANTRGMGIVIAVLRLNDITAAQKQFVLRVEMGK